ncbi:MAG: Omp28-related outer membrane protein [Candidatus Cryptobacteroides sp.]
MKRDLYHIFAGCILACVSIISASCSGTVDNSVSDIPVLTPDKTVITADGKDVVTFTVASAGVDVTSKSDVYCIQTGERLSKKTFTTKEPGIYTFKAVYSDKESEEKAVKAEEKQTVVSAYARQVCIMEFTGAWCAFCPDGYTKLNMLISGNEMYSKYVHMVGLHSKSGGDDPMALDVVEKIYADFKDPSGSALAFPSFVTDFREAGGLTTNTDARNSLVNSFEEYPAHCGVSVSSKYDSAASKAEVAVKVTSELTSSYRLTVLVVEDRIKSPQKNGSMTDPEYPHRHVLRQILTATYKGTDLGTVEKGTEVEKTFTIDVNPEWNLDETSVYALVLDNYGYVNNMNLCKIDGGDSGYEMK